MVKIASVTTKSLDVEMTVATYDLTVVFMDGETQTFPAIESHRAEDNVLRIRCHDEGKPAVYSLPLVSVRMWHRELT